MRKLVPWIVAVLALTGAVFVGSQGMASASVTGYTTVRATATIYGTSTVGPVDSYVHADCPSGDEAIGGGFELTESGGNIMSTSHVVADQPYPPIYTNGDVPTAWFAIVRSDPSNVAASNPAGTLAVYAICATI